jgi:kinetochore protein Spc25, fungi type
MSRPPQIDLAMLLEQQNPQIDLRIQAYETTTRNFLKAVTSFKNKAIALIIERRNAQATEIKRATEKIQVVEAETNQCKLKELEMLAGMYLWFVVMRHTQFSPRFSCGKGTRRTKGS